MVIPVGDIAGVGLEIMVKAVGHPEVYEWCRPVVVKKLSATERAVSMTESKVRTHRVEHPDEMDAGSGVLDLIDLKNVDVSEIEFGKVQRDTGRAVSELIERSVELLKSGEADTIATTTISKGALKAASIRYVGHTEIIGGLLGAEDSMTTFQVQNLRVFFLSKHLSSQQAIKFVTEEHIYRYTKRVHQGVQNLGIESPRLAIAGLSPHGGEYGLFDWEGVREVAPAVERARAEGTNAEEPIGADSVFYLALKGNFDAITSLYHNQRHIVTRMADSERTISVMVGMPYIRTSVNHGTAFDVVGKNLTNEVSMRETIRLAAEYSVTYKPGIC